MERRWPGYRGFMNATILSILMLAGLALLAGGLTLIVRRREWKRGTLMLVAALVMFGNVVIMTMPM